MREWARNHQSMLAMAFSFALKLLHLPPELQSSVSLKPTGMHFVLIVRGRRKPQFRRVVFPNGHWVQGSDLYQVGVSGDAEAAR